MSHSTSYRHLDALSLALAPVIAVVAASTSLARLPVPVAARQPAASPSATTAGGEPAPGPTATIVERRAQPAPAQSATSWPTGSLPIATSAQGASQAGTATAAATPAVTLPVTAPTPTGAPTIEHEERPIIVIRDFGVDPGRPAPGSGFRLSLRLKNVGEHFAENIRLGFSSTAFFPVDTGAMPHVNTLPAGDSKTVDVDMRVSAAATGGAQGLTIALQWDDSYGGSYADETTIGIEVGEPASRPSVVVTAARLPGRVAPGIAFDLSLDFINTGGQEARSLVVTLSGPPLATQGGVTGAPLTLAPNGTATVNLRVVASALAEPGAASQTVELRYEDPAGERYTDSQNVGLVVSDNAAVAPMPVIAQYEIEPAEIHASDVFTLELTVTNVGAADAQQTRLLVGGGEATGAAGASASTSGAATAAGSVFAPLGTGNVRFLDRLAAGESRTVHQRMVVSNAAKPGVYSLSVGLAYLDMFGQAVQDTQLVTLLVGRRIVLDINPIDVITSTVVGSQVPFSFEIINPLTEDVNTSTVEIQAGRYMTVQDGTQFVGPLSGGAVYAVSANLTPRAPTDRALVKVIVHYSDDFGRDQQMERQFVFEIAAAPERGASQAESLAPAQGISARRVLLGLLGLGASARMPKPAESPPPSAAPAGTSSGPSATAVEEGP